MIIGGTGGANTTTGRRFENDRDFLLLLSAQDGYRIAQQQVAWANIYFQGSLVAHSIRQHSLYRFLTKERVDWKSLLSKKLLPDEAIYVPSKKLVSIIEMKYQQTAGSVDEKLQTCHFKVRQYRRLFRALDIDVKYIYLLGDWFKKPEYHDVLAYIDEVGCKYYFDELPLADIGMPEN